jgi:hypothetical protein
MDISDCCSCFAWELNSKTRESGVYNRPPIPAFSSGGLRPS